MKRINKKIKESKNRRKHKTCKWTGPMKIEFYISITWKLLYYQNEGIDHLIMIFLLSLI
jgi:hypothetical protein